MSGATVRHLACGQNDILRFGNVRRRSVVRKRSSPRRRRFFWCSVVTFVCEYWLTICGCTRTGNQSSSFGLRALIRYMEKHPGRHVTPPNAASNAFD